MEIAHVNENRSLAARQNLESCKDAEQEISTFLKEKKSPFHRDFIFTRSKLQHIYEKVIFGDFEFAQEKAIEIALWKRVFYSVIERCRADLRDMEKRDAQRAISAANQKENNNNNNTNGDKKHYKKSPEYRKLHDQYRNFLITAVKFYLRYLEKLASEFAIDQIRDILLRHQMSFERNNEKTGHVSSKLQTLALQSCHRTLIFLGDIERYKQLTTIRLPHDFTAAITYYNDARFLLTTNGHPFNQLGVIAAYSSKDYGFEPMYYYYRATCVMQPFEIAPNNLEQLFTKAYDITKKDGMDRNEVIPFLANYIRLHAFIFLKHGNSKNGAEEYDKVEETVLIQFKRDIIHHKLSQEAIFKVVVSAIACLHTLHQRKSANGKKSDSETKEQTRRRRIAEMRSLLLIARIFCVLFDVGNAELSSLPADDQCSNVAEDGTRSDRLISSTLKRILPALRICTKWMVSHSSSMCRIWQKHAIIGTLYDWYAQLQNHIIKEYSNLPFLAYALEEDVELTGFLPLRNTLLDFKDAAKRSAHPNEEHLMRLYDLKKDASIIAKQVDGGLEIFDGIYKAKPTPTKLLKDIVPSDFFGNDTSTEVAPCVNESMENVGFSLEEMVDDIIGDGDQEMKVVAVTNEDPQESDSDGEQIVLERKSPFTISLSKQPTPSPSSPNKENQSTKNENNSITTASDLVAQILNPSTHFSPISPKKQQNAWNPTPPISSSYQVGNTEEIPSPFWNTTFSSPIFPTGTPTVPLPPVSSSEGIFGSNGPFGSGRGQTALPGIWSQSWSAAVPAMRAPPGLYKTNTWIGYESYPATKSPWKEEKTEQGEWEGYG